MVIALYFELVRLEMYVLRQSRKYMACSVCHNCRLRSQKDKVVVSTTISLSWCSLHLGHIAAFSDKMRFDDYFCSVASNNHYIQWTAIQNNSRQLH